jgi:hypothetical protein
MSEREHAASNVLHENYEQIVTDGAECADKPQEARAWITSFGNFAPGMDVSTDLLCFHSKSLLPVLTSWIQIWFQRTQKARRQARLGTLTDDREMMMNMQYHGVSLGDDNISQVRSEEANLEWLFDYISDYLALDQDVLPPSELQDLSNALLQICQSTTVFDDIEQSTNVIFVMLQKWSLPQDAVEPLLQVLCNTRTSLSRSMPSHLVDCITLLVTGELASVTRRYLLAFIGKVGTIDSSKKSTALARGAVLFLGDVVKMKDKSGALVVQFSDLIKPLKAASSTGAPRLCTDILHLCNMMMKKAAMLATIVTEFEPMMVIVENCALIAKARAAVRLYPQLAKTQNLTIDGEDSYQQANLSSTNQVKQTLIELWRASKLKSDHQLLVYRFCMDTPDDTDEPTLLFLLQFAEAQKLCNLHQPQGEEVEIHRIVQNLVRNKAMSARVRNKALDIVHEANLASRLPRSHSETLPDVPNDEDSFNVVDTWLQQLQIEEDPDVSKNIVHSLEQTAIQSPYETHAQQIIIGLEALILREEHSEGILETLVTSTQALINITLHSSSSKASFNALLKVASIECKSTEARIEALRFLFRLRADSDGVLYIQNYADSEYIAAALCRTRESADSFSFSETVEPRRKSGSTTSLSIQSSSTTSGWMYPDTEVFDKSQQFSHITLTTGYQDGSHAVLDMGSWLITMAECLQRDQNWETYSYLIVHAGSQLANTTLFSGSDRLLETVVKFRQVLCERISIGKLLKPPTSTGLKDSDVAICLFNVLTGLIPYATIKAAPIQKAFADELVKAFLTGVGGTWEGTSRGCIHALSICCLEMPASVANSYPTIVDRMSRNMTQSHLSMHILELLAQIARLPAVHSNFQDEEILMIFSICIQFLERARERPTAHVATGTPRSGTPAARQSGLSARRPPYRAQMLVDLGLSHYNSALVYHVMIFWFLSLKLSVRARSIKWIVPRLVWKDRHNEEQVDEQAMVFIDMMQRTAYSDLGETGPHPQFATAEDGKISSASWVVAQSIVTIETAGHTGLTQITKRQSSGTTHAVYQQHTMELPSHHTPVTTGIRPDEDDASGTIEMLPSHVLLQMAATADPVSFRKQPVLLPKDDVTRRAIQSFDRLVTVDSHKLGVIYIGPNQILEKDYLANTCGSVDYNSFLESIGTRVSLSPPLRFNPQGLQNGIDGTETYAWRDRVTEIVFHVTTMMPTNTTDDPGCTQKKSHVGNCHVNIIYNRSGLPWDFGNFASQLNYVNIVVEPANRSDTSVENIDFYSVHTLTAPQFPAITPASDPKIISAAQMPQFVRLVALNANVFCQAWNVRDTDTEFPSSWRARLQAIKKLREKVVSKEKGSLAQQLDFSGFTLAP